MVRIWQVWIPAFTAPNPAKSKPITNAKMAEVFCTVSPKPIDHNILRPCLLYRENDGRVVYHFWDQMFQGVAARRFCPGSTLAEVTGWKCSSPKLGCSEQQPFKSGGAEFVGFGTVNCLLGSPWFGLGPPCALLLQIIESTGLAGLSKAS
jgi:hypothetical protein